MTRVATKVNSREFVLAWIDAHNRKRGVAAVAEKLGLTHEQAQSKANQLRSKGVKLPKMSRTNVGFSVDDLNRIIEAKVAQ